jgi:transglutaminase-like putative cysteine protease
VTLGPQVVRLRPAPHCRTPILSYALNVVPSKHSIHWQQDPFANYQARLLFSEKTTEFSVEVDLVAELIPINPFDYFLEPDAATYPFQYSAALARDLEPYRALQPAGHLLQRFLNGVSRAPRPTPGFLVDLNQQVRDEIGYTTRLEPGIQSCEETLGNRSGSCRDSRPASFRATWFNWLQTKCRGTPSRCMPGRRFTCPARAGLAWIQRRD